MAWSFSTLRLIHHPLMASISAKSLAMLSDFRPQERANTAWAMSTLPLRNEPLMTALAAQALSNISACTPQGLANTSWALATLECCDDTLWQSIASSALNRLSHFEPRGLAGFSWALATRRCTNAPLLDAISSEALAKLSAFRPSELSSTASAYASLLCHNHPLLDAIASASINRLSAFGPKGLSSMAWSCSALACRNAPLMAAISAQAISRLALTPPVRSSEALAPSWYFKSQELSSLSWAYASCEIMDLPLFSAISAEAINRLTDGEPQLLVNISWSYSVLSLLDDPLRAAIAAASLNPRRSCCPKPVRPSIPSGAVNVLDEMREVSPSSAGSLDAAGGSAERPSSTTMSPSLPPSGSLTESLWIACGGDPGKAPEALGLKSSDIPPRTPYSKELRLLAHVLETARFGDAEAVCEAMERFGEDVLSPSGQWLKIAGDVKADVLAHAVRRAPDRGSILEIGTYCGYSAIRMALACPGVRIVSLEVDPAHVVIARNVIAFAGLGHMVDVWTGHSKDTLPRLAARYKGNIRFRAVFMDQRGSRYEEDLDVLEGLGLLERGSVVVADNVLKPGSPLFLWRLFHSGAYDAHIVSLKEFAMPVEDWMSVSISTGPPPGENPEWRGRRDDPADDLVQLQWESDRVRAQATRPGGHSVTYEEWSDFVADMKARLAVVGIAATVKGAEMGAAPFGSRTPKL